MKRGFVKNSLGNAPRSPMGTQLHFTQAQLNRNKDFVVPVLDSSRAVPPDKGKKDSKQDWLQKQISGKKFPLVFWKFLCLISIMHLTPKWRQILLFFCLYNNWRSMPDFKVKIILNSTGVIEAKSLKHEASQAFQTWYIKHEVQMASKSSDVALLILEIILSFFIIFHRHAWMKWQMFRIFLATIEMDSLSLLLLFNLVFHPHLTLCKFLLNLPTKRG